MSARAPLLLFHPFTQSLAKCLRATAWGLRRAWPKQAGWGVIAGLLGTPAAAEPASLCGITAANVAGYRAAVLADPRFQRDGGDALRETFSAESIQAIWTFTTARNPVHPAALCEQVVDRGGAMQIERHPVCEAGAGPCARFDAEIKARDNGSGDGE